MIGPEKIEGKSFARALRVEWTIFRKSRVLLLGTAIAALLTLLIGLRAVSNSYGGTDPGRCNGDPICLAAPTPVELVGPDGEVVDDKFYFVYQPLVGNGSITVRLTKLSGEFVTHPPNARGVVIVSGVQPWAKAGIIIKENLKQGSPYAAMMITGSHGVRMQYNFTHDIASLPGSVSATSPRWLRLARSGDMLTGYASTNGTQWTTVGTADLAGLPATVQIGLFVTSPFHQAMAESGGSDSYSPATAVFDHVSLLQDEASRSVWSRDDFGVAMYNGKPYHPGSLIEAGGTFTVIGNGDIAPLGDQNNQTIESILIGVVVGLLVMCIMAVLFMSAEDLTGRISFAKRVSSERRVLVAKALVLGLVTFSTQLVVIVVAVQLGKRIMEAHGFFHEVPLLIELRLMLGTAAVVALAAVFALALEAVFRHRFVAIIAALALTVVPFILAFVNLVPDAVSRWLLLLTPAAGFAIQQSFPAYPQVDASYTLQGGYYPLAPWAGFAVLCGYTLLALGLALFLTRPRRQ
ncbi:hypothetical protein EPA93_07685 [Ktedonosporobacter rubrisoli]|uniref:DUF1349 domain-containing protein n=1 Tax=Ktedonosporobacter rubrisoli TaxID=2509675 RepID=A0A4P6JL42_KTERU|nr:hypothetical protein [Ktedonosporobacter rubrisoli]QBD75895.1 hypothetical protein EPA93_07685 [Ktedonosporobacter rubrisoli]